MKLRVISDGYMEEVLNIAHIEYSDTKEEPEFLDFLKEEGVHLKGREFGTIKKDFKILGIIWYQIKECFSSERLFLFSYTSIKEGVA